jgi:hypothetical protein
MTVILPNSVFLHVPKAGGTWVRQALKNTELVRGELTSRHSEESTEGKKRSWHMVPRDKSILQGKYVFCFVRHPLTWYQSHWAFRTRRSNWNSGNILDKRCVLDCEKERMDFNDFIDNVIEEFPEGYLHWLYNFYAQHAVFVGKMENLQSDLVNALFMAGEDFDVGTIANTPRENVMPRKYHREVKYTTARAIKILELERKVIEKYGYNYQLPLL